MVVKRCTACKATFHVGSPHSCAPVPNHRLSTLVCACPKPRAARSRSPQDATQRGPSRAARRAEASRTDNRTAQHQTCHRDSVSSISRCPTLPPLPPWQQTATATAEATADATGKPAEEAAAARACEAP
eukprot:350899-Chlamydomonas_euryale.AAC.1